MSAQHDTSRPVLDREIDLRQVAHLLSGSAAQPKRWRELPPAPREPQDTGLPPLMLSDLPLKAMHQYGLQHLSELSHHLKLGVTLLEELLGPLRKDGLVEVRLRGARDGDVSYELTTAGRARAADALARNLYCGPAPVSLSAYVTRAQMQSIAGVAITQERFAAALADVPMRPHLRDQLGAAMNSRHAALLYGPPGAGKSFLCHQMARLLSGRIAVPYAIEVGGEIIQFFDPLVHRAVRAGDATQRTIDGHGRADDRWVLCERPVVVTGSELTLEALDLVFDARAGYYHAPPQLKATNGLLLIDDLGRQMVTPRQLLDRWLMPLEQRHDRLRLRNGSTFQVPFDNQLFFSTNLEPQQLADDAFLRRIGYKIYVGAIDARDYRRLVQDACEAMGVRYEDSACDHLIARHQRRPARPMLACHPRDLMSQVADQARYLGCAPEMNVASVEWAWQNYFGTTGDDDNAHANRGS
jgi:DNA-binding PadR family transcriptional regulator